jgi:hypothetical protein
MVADAIYVDVSANSQRSVFVATHPSRELTWTIGYCTGHTGS